VVMAGRPGRIRETIEIQNIRKDEDWDSKPVEDVMEMDSFVHLRTQVWRLLRDSSTVQSPGGSRPRLSIAS
jgi:NitT/TauT family transport system ATP-binding protein